MFVFSLFIDGVARFHLFCSLASSGLIEIPAAEIKTIQLLEMIDAETDTYSQEALGEHNCYYHLNMDAIYNENGINALEAPNINVDRKFIENDDKVDSGDDFSGVVDIDEAVKKSLKECDSFDENNVNYSTFSDAYSRSQKQPVNKKQKKKTRKTKKNLLEENESDLEPEGIIFEKSYI